MTLMGNVILRVKSAWLLEDLASNYSGVNGALWLSPRLNLARNKRRLLDSCWIFGHGGAITCTEKVTTATGKAPRQHFRTNLSTKYWWIPQECCLA